MAVLGAVILVAVGLYYLFAAVDRMGLATERASARVVGKEYQPLTRTSRPQVINNRTINVPEVRPETFVLELDLAGRRVQGTTDRALYEAVEAGDQVQVSYQQRRITGGLQVVEVSR